MLQNEADESSEFDNYIISESSVYEKGWGSRHDDIFLAFDKDGQLLKKNNNGSKFLDDSNSSVPPLTAFHMHLIFRNNKLAQLALLRY